MKSVLPRPSFTTDTGNIGFKVAESFLDKEKGLPNLVSMLDELGSGIFETSPAMCKLEPSAISKGVLPAASFEGASISRSSIEPSLSQGECLVGLSITRQNDPSARGFSSGSFQQR